MRNLVVKIAAAALIYLVAIHSAAAADTRTSPTRLLHPLRYAAPDGHLLVLRLDSMAVCAHGSVFFWLSSDMCASSRLRPRQAEGLSL